MHNIIYFNCIILKITNVLKDWDGSLFYVLRVLRTMPHDTQHDKKVEE